MYFIIYTPYIFFSVILGQAFAQTLTGKIMDITVHHTPTSLELEFFESGKKTLLEKKTIPGEGAHFEMDGYLFTQQGASECLLVQWNKGGSGLRLHHQKKAILSFCLVQGSQKILGQILTEFSAEKIVKGKIFEQSKFFWQLKQNDQQLALELMSGAIRRYFYLNPQKGYWTNGPEFFL
jgi:hypothetical protein